MRALMFALALAACATGGAAPPQLDVMRGFEGCWLGDFEGAALQDQRCFTALEGGQRWRDTHEVLGTGYGGATIYAFDAADDRIVIAYSANDGGRMSAHADAVDGGLDFPDGRYVGADGQVQELRSRWRLNGDRFEATTERLENGAWVRFMRISYRRTAAS